jgi:hypothetical protein
MSRVADVYRTSLTLLTDLYQLTVAQAYWASGNADKEAVFHLLEPVVRGGRVVREPPPLSETRSRTSEQLGRLHPGIKRLVDPQRYPVGLSAELGELKTRLVGEMRHD